MSDARSSNPPPQPSSGSSSGPPSGAPPVVSVLIAAYNAAGFMGRAVDSALSQDGVALELVIVDDASTDGTLAAAQEFARRDGRVRVVALPENLGPAGARNAGLEAARGSWVAVLDADDAYLPGRLAALLETAAETGADLVADNFLFYHAKDGSRSEPALRTEPAVETLSAHDFVARARPFAEEADYGLLKPMFRKAFLDRHDLRYPTHSRHGEDFLFVLEILLKGGRYALSRRPGYLYTTRNSGLSRTRVDYDAQVAQSLSLTRRAPVSADARLAELLHRRVGALRRLSAQHQVSRLFAQREYRGIVQLALTDRAVGAEVLRRLKRRVARA